ncbi:MAG: sugar ABC transporter ATP-binding protein [Spirochaetaceae bacterium]|jgi:simple sugar transport system ATP-binding protein|nr:sugar ABC transporter ATP-binding protein [Spirochaetaceae bacterium]
MPLLRLENVSKDFYGTPVLKNVSFSVGKGEIVALVGENGAGKTTLMHILFGMSDITGTGGYGGNIYLDGKPVSFKNPFEALDAGIGMVHQEFSLIAGFRADENILLNREPVKRNFAVPLFGARMSILLRGKMRQTAETVINKLNVAIEPETPVSGMPVAHKQFTEIAREISRENVRLLVMDEPTAVLTESEAELLIDACRKLAAEGIAIIFISHRLRELTALADKIVVLRDGEVVKDIKNDNVLARDIAGWMVGRKIDEGAGNEGRVLNTEPVLEVEHLWVDMPGEPVRDVSFSVKRGEIFGIGALAGQGKLGIPNGIMGIYPAGGRVRFEDRVWEHFDPLEMQKNGMAFVSEDRRGVGLLLDETLEWNITFGAMQIANKNLLSFLGGLIKIRDEKSMRHTANEYIEKLAIKCTGSKQLAKELSGGNQQKVCLAKSFALEPKLLFVSEPTRGIDVGAKKIVLDTLREVNRRDDVTIVMISSELEELRSVCDRIAIVSEGGIAGILPPDAGIAEFGLLMVGGDRGGEKKNE